MLVSGMSQALICASRPRAWFVGVPHPPSPRTCKTTRCIYCTGTCCVRVFVTYSSLLAFVCLYPVPAFVLSVCVGRLTRWTQALELLARIKNRGLAPDVISFSSAMYACDRAGKWQVTRSSARGLDQNALEARQLCLLNRWSA